MFGARAERVLNEVFGGGCCDASAALYSDCCERPPMRGGCRDGGCGTYSYGMQDRYDNYYAQRSMPGVSLYGGGCGGMARGLFGGGLGFGLARGLFGGGFGGGMLGGLLGGIIGRIISRFGGGGGGGCDDGSCDGGGGNDFDFDDDNRERDFDRYQRKRRRILDEEQEERNRLYHPDQRDNAHRMSGFETEALRLINSFRHSNGLHSVEYDPRLQYIAEEHSKYQNANGLGHNEDRPGWRTPSQRMQQVGLKGWAENAAYGSISTPQQLVQMWINSPGHRRALLDPNVQIAGISKIGKGATLDMV